MDGWKKSGWRRQRDPGLSFLRLSCGPAPASRKKGEPGRDMVFGQTMTLLGLPCKH